MKTAVTEASIAAYHTHPAKSEQALKVAEYAANETKHGRLVWIGKLAEHFALHGHHDLAQKSTASARLAEIKAKGVILNGRKYELKLMKEEKPPGGRCKVEMWALIIEQPMESAQLKMF